MKTPSTGKMPVTHVVFASENSRSYGEPTDGKKRDTEKENECLMSFPEWFQSREFKHEPLRGISEKGKKKKIGQDRIAFL